MEYITVKEAAGRWKYAERSIQNYCANEKIPGAKCVGGQWFIPAEAKPPVDGRTKAAREQQPADHYRFPVFLYSRFYRDRSELTADEQSLLQAQLLHFEGKHMQSLSLCHDLLKEKHPSCLTAGIYLTIGIDSFMLGLVSQYRDAVSNLERITDAEEAHKEDFRLLTAALKYYIDWNSFGITEIIPENLSAEAVWYYRTVIFSVSALSSNGLPLLHLRYLESECVFFEKEGMLPMLYFHCCGLGVLNDCVRPQEEKEKFLRRGVELAVENNWVHNLHRFYNFSPAIMAEILKSYGNSYYNELLKAQKTTMENWNTIRMKETGSDYNGLFSSKQYELLHLIGFGYTDKEIALCTGLSESVIRRRAKTLMEISGTKNKIQLRAYAAKFFDSSYLEKES